MSPNDQGAAGALRAVVVDDESLARTCVRVALERRADVRIVAECEDGEAAASAVAELDPDLVILDVQMPGVDGFGVIERVGAERMPPVIFVTAHDVHALRAFQVRALDYVLKPFDDARLADALDRARAQIRLRRDGELGRRLAALVADVRAAPDGAAAVAAAGPDAGARRRGWVARLTVRTDDGRARILAASDVDWFEGAGNYVRLHIGAASFRIRASLAGLAPRLDPVRFVRVHRSTIVNVARIREVQPWFGGDYIAILHDGRQLRVSRTYARDLLRPVWS
ncbi:MAG TPA: LytTR family DNA-binding domain-containing protein [Gemmatimonadaceae bacterium]